MCLDKNEKARIWDEGYAAGDRDAYNAANARDWNGRTLDEEELTKNPYLEESTNKELWE